MLPVVRGEAFTHACIVVYIVLLVAFTIAPFITGLFGVLYLAPHSPRRRFPRPRGVARRCEPSRTAALALHLASLAYLALLFVAMAVDSRGLIERLRWTDETAAAKLPAGLLFASIAVGVFALAFIVAMLYISG